MEATPTTGKPVITEVQELPPLMDLQMPPPALPQNSLLLLVGSMAMLRILPPIPLKGPMGFQSPLAVIPVPLSDSC